MALFKSLRGKRENLPSTKTDGYAYFCTNDGTFWIDYKDENGVVQRKQLNAKDAETLLGASLSTILNSSDVEIPTSKAVLDALEKYIDDMFGMSELSLRASGWTGTESPYSQVVEVSGVTANSKVDLNPTGEQLNSLATNRTILNTANDNGTVTVYAIGNKPTEDYTMQATITEV